MNHMIKLIREAVKVHGWTVITVGPDTERMCPGFAYTIGLTAKGLPELIIMALPPKTAVAVLNTVVAQLSSGQVIADGVDIPAVANLPLRLRSVDQMPTGVDHWVESALEQPILAIRQVVWPDPDGRFPDDPSMDSHLAALQEPVQLVDDPAAH